MMSGVPNAPGARRRIGLNAHLLSLTETYRGAGINGYIYQLLRHLPAADARYQYAAYLYEPEFHVSADTPWLEVCRSGWDTRRPWRRILWEQSRLAAFTQGLDLLHGLAFAAPLAAACPTIVTVHDLSFLRFPAAFRPFNRWYLSWITRASTRRAARVIAVSESTRKDVIALCGIAPERVVTIPNGVTEDFSPASSLDSAAFRRQRGLPGHYILFLGTLEPRKNLVRLIEAYALWRRRQVGTGVSPAKLVIAGGKGWFFERVFARASELGLVDEVLFPGYVPAQELPWWYRAADLFIYPSVFEGFGLPVLEAMACGTPTITSTAPALADVAGDAALLVDPADTEALAEAIGRVLGDPATAEALRLAGPCQAARFPWTRTAATTAGLYCSVLGESPR
jgi:glycosyltransferase involved in cell wall biosynthesis